MDARGICVTYRCLDAETTGLPSDETPSGVMELGWCDMRFDIIKPPVSVLVDCGIPVSIEARAVHHISDEMVAGELTPDEAMKLVTDGPHEYVCAHNIDHEKKYVGTGFLPGTQEQRKWLCTYKTALRIWPDAPGHKLMELRYFLKLDDAEDFDPKLATPPHRAPADAYVCAHLLRRVLKEVTVEQMVRWSSGPALLYMCFMRKHKGKPWHQVAQDDRPYLEWIFNKSDVQDRDIRATVKYYLNRTAKGPSAEGNPYQP
jgi:exodeoxyribonuclease X